MSSRSIILNKIKASKSLIDGGADLPEITFDGLSNTAGFTREELVEGFAKELEAVNGRVYRVEEGEGRREKICRIIEEIIRERGFQNCATSEEKYLKELELDNFLIDKGFGVLKDFAAKSDLSNVEVGITCAQYAIAKTGTLVITHSKENQRWLSLLPQVHVVIIEKGNILSDTSELVAILDDSLFSNRGDIRKSNSITWITGPSRTADIELNLVLGVHGPKELLCIVV